jgi:hypothetical protein
MEVCPRSVRKVPVGAELGDGLGTMVGDEVGVRLGESVVQQLSLG